VGAVSVIPILSDGRVVMERQFRYAHNWVFLEIPAGKLDSADEPRIEAARRELKEETGAVAGSMTCIGELDTTPALIDEKITMYMAEDLCFSGERCLDEDEFLNLELIPLWKLVDMVMAGEIKDAKTQISVLKAAKLRPQYLTM
jgi:ADP-ribose pyrophosphatase